ncbi:hypothetical protein PFISCL1PPCAC_8058 [Pristionchus fissidentatus]|uniref:Alpha-1,3-glucosyltransferase n=1 Tax=Pristionchus fissidentatus TaxID=1538716 RepID=A0AAV5VDE8_9BILA|nr:hypothetical protein PFISCL1PPCAC_8058 [Pristionchus fissidentatus]
MADPPFTVNEEYVQDTTKKLQFNEFQEQPRSVQPSSMPKQAAIRDRGISVLSLTVVVLLGVVVQLVVGLGSYSGKGRPPMHGDFEAQRHWMEITHHLPVQEWYRNTSSNNLQYWGLDYPPLTAYHSKLMGWIAHRIDPSWVALSESQGIETASHKLFMRLSAVLSHLLTFTPGVVLWLSVKRPLTIHPVHEALLIVLFPGLISVDHGHFQYNSISLGLFLISVYFLVYRKTVIASIFFVLALNYKQMELYHSLPIFVYILAVSLKLYYHQTEKYIVVDFLQSAANLWTVGLTTLCTFLLMWTPLAYFGDENTAVDAIKRIFPFERGLFEDKVASVWCAFNPIGRFTDIDRSLMMKFSMTIVLFSSLPSLLILFLAPTSRFLRLTLFIVSLNFFLFSYQVHEKSILLAAVPALLLMQEMPLVVFSFLTTASCSLFSLCIKDDNERHLLLFFGYFIYAFTVLPKSEGRGRYLFLLRGLLSFFLNMLEMYGTPPTRYPHFYPYITAVYSCVCFLCDLIYLNYYLIQSYLLAGPKPKTE